MAQTKPHVQVIAHRGASHVERENTVAAFRRAREMGAHAVELDVRRSADGALVVHHDAHLADGRVIGDLARADLPPHVPTLAEALDACDGMWVNIEIKSFPDEAHFDPERGLAFEVVRLLQERPDPPSRWVISAFDREMIERVHREWPALPTAWLTFDADTGVLRELAAAGHVAVHPFVGLVTEEMVAAAHAEGLSLNTWTCDDPARMAELVAWSVDGICTNVPDVALGVVDQSLG